jgi:hypothetical protein
MGSWRLPHLILPQPFPGSPIGGIDVGVAVGDEASGDVGTLDEWEGTDGALTLGVGSAACTPADLDALFIDIASTSTHPAHGP